MVNLLVAIPCVDGFVPIEWLSILSAQSSYKEKFNKINFMPVRSVPHDSARNLIVSKMLEMPIRPTHVMFIDSDVIVPNDAFVRLVESDKDVCAARVMMYLADKNSFGIAAGIKEGKHYTSKGVSREKADENGLQQVDSVGFGAVMVKTKVLQEIAKPAFKFHYDSNGVMQKSEDISFCELAKEAGFEIWLNHDVQCIHRKQVDLNL